LADEEINIDNMINRSRDTIAYTVIDTGMIAESLLKKIKARLLQIPEVIRVRALEK
jgi:D-3-phosphoglycerate dehydrogenase